METVKFNTDEILARIKSVRETGPSMQSNTKVSEWIENMAILSTYAESTYKETVVDVAEFTIPPIKDESEVVPRDVKFEVVQEWHPQPQSPMDWRGLGSSMSKTSEETEESDESATVIDTSQDDHLIGPTTIFKTKGLRSLHIDENSPSTPTTSPSRDHDGIRGTRRPIEKYAPPYTLVIPTAHHGSNETGFLGRSNGDVPQVTIQHPASNRLMRSDSPRAARSQVSTNGVEDTEHVRTIVSLACPDLRLIHESTARTALLREKDKVWLDDKITPAIGSDNETIIRDALSKGVDPNVRRRNESGLRTPLSVAIAASTKLDCVLALLQYGAKPNVRRYLPGCRGEEQPIMSALAFAAWESNEPLVWALVSAGAAVNPGPSA
ncbi:hypothetical protein QQZ08_000543 [Neonectria magnoliae]|uniref:Ankyrin repeat protein n=1 Tax=Neonectria magnoliae TaxID=2732573 RepID=A0ABR1IJM7_9HYPO